MEWHGKGPKSSTSLDFFPSFADKDRYSLLIVLLIVLYPFRLVLCTYMFSILGWKEREPFSLIIIFIPPTNGI